MISLFFLFLLCACNQSDEQPLPDSTTVTATPPSYLALGDSYTIGQSVAPSERFPVQFVDMLRSDSVLAEDPQIIATTGWRTDQLIDAVEAASLADTFDLVSLLIGVNNQFQGRPIEEYEVEFRQLLETSIQLAQGDTNRVFVLSIPDYAFTPYGQNANPESISAGVDAFNLVNKEITEMMGVRYFNITPISRKGVDEPELVASDGLHPSGEQYRQWVELFYDEIREVVED